MSGFPGITFMFYVSPMRNTYSLLFYIKRSSLRRDGTAPIMARITVNGERAQFSTRLAVAPDAWCAERGRVSPRRQGAKILNMRLADLREKVDGCYYALLAGERPVTALRVRERLFGSESPEPALLEFFEAHNAEFRALVGTERSVSTYNKYQSVLLHLAAYVRCDLKRRDVRFAELDRSFVVGFCAYLRAKEELKRNTVWVYLIAFKHVLTLARGRGYMQRDIFADYKLKSDSSLRNYLTMKELERLAGLRLCDGSLRFVRDLFLFSAFTGISYVDLRDLSMRDLRTLRGHKWIVFRRRKTGGTVTVRLFSLPLRILHRYAAGGEHPFASMPSNSWCNRCLGVLMQRIGIVRRVTFHAARHTFATTVTLSQGVSIEVISKLLGHKNIRTTQIYAEITPSRLDRDMERLARNIDRTSELWGVRG